MYVVNCHKLQLIVGGKAPNIVIENCIGVELLVATQDEEHAVETEKSSGVIISISKLEVPSPIPRLILFLRALFLSMLP